MEAIGCAKGTILCSTIVGSKEYCAFCSFLSCSTTPSLKPRNWCNYFLPFLFELFITSVSTIWLFWTIYRDSISIALSENSGDKSTWVKYGGSISSSRNGQIWNITFRTIWCCQTVQNDSLEMIHKGWCAEASKELYLLLQLLAWGTDGTARTHSGE